MNVLTIGHYNLLFPASVDVGKLLNALSKATQCRYRDYTSPPAVIVEEGHLELGIKVVSPHAKFVKQRGEVEEEVVIYAKGPQQLRLNAPKKGGAR